MIRTVLPSEWRAWRDLRLRSLSDDPDAFAETHAEAASRDDAGWRALVAADPTRSCWFALHHGVPVGTTVATVTADSAQLYAMWVAPEARRIGLGRALLGTATRWARLAGATTLALRVTDRSHRAAPRLAGQTVGVAAHRPDVAASALYRGFLDRGSAGPLRPGSPLQTRDLVIRLGPLVIGVVNVTPDSFSDGGDYFAPDVAIAHGLALYRDGADIVDVGGEASNPQARPIEAEEEWRRIQPVVAALAKAGAPVSVDTTKAAVAERAVAAGATIVNDVSGGLFDPGMAALLEHLPVTYIIGHLRGRSLAEVFAAEAPVSWQAVAGELADRLAALPAAMRARCWVDPGIGFGKGSDPEGNLALVRHAGDIGRIVGCPVVIGPSRKRFLKRLSAAADLAALDAASVAASLDGVRGGAHVVRVHNVALLQAALAVYTRI